jgi:hypothetical protein
MYAAKKPDKVDPHEEALARWTRCALTGEPLRPPVVADALGALLNKEAAVAALLARGGGGGGADGARPLPEHVTGLRSLTDVKLALAVDVRGGAREEAAGEGAAAAAAAAAAGAPPRPPPAASADAADAVLFACPVTGAPMNGRFRFYLHKPSGVVLSERALREAPRAIVEEALGADKQDEAATASAPLPPFATLQQQAAVGEGDFLPLHPSGPELTKLRTAVMARLEAERERKAAKKKNKKKSREEGEEEGEHEAGARGGKSNKKKQRADAAAAAPLRVPEGATPSVYASIFAKPGAEEVKETYCSRSVSGRHA